VKGKAAIAAASRPDKPTGFADGAALVAEEVGAAGDVTAGFVAGVGRRVGVIAGRTAGEVGAAAEGSAPIAADVAEGVAGAGAAAGARPADRLLRSRVTDDAPD
jgi:hypothetical protein